MMITQDIVNIPECFREILPLYPVDRAEAFTGVHIIESERPFQGLGSALECERRARHARCGGQGSETEQAAASEAVMARWRSWWHSMHQRFPSLHCGM